MARRKSSNRKFRQNSRSRSIDSVGSGLLDLDTAIVDEEETFWWNHLQENTFPPHSLIHSKNETPRQLSDNTRMDSIHSVSEWWKNLESSDNESVALTRCNAAIVKTNILQTSTSESEKEHDLKKKKVRLKAANRKSSNNAFANALDDSESIPLKLRMKRANYPDLHSDLDKEATRRRSQEEDSNSSLTGKILKSKPSISRKRRGRSIEDQNTFQDILTESALSGNTMRKSVALEKESPKHRNIDVSKNTDDQKKSIRASQTMPVEDTETVSPTPNVEDAVPENNANEIVQSSDESDIIPNQRLKLKSRFMQRARKSIGKNAFEDALADNSSTHLSVSNSNKENDIHISPVSRSSLTPLKRSVNRSNAKIDITSDSSPIHKSPRSSLNATKKQSLDIPVQAEDNTEINSNDSLDDNKSRETKRSVFLKPKSRIIKKFRKSSINPFEQIFEHNINDRGNSIEDNRTSSERDETITRTSKVHESLATEKSLQSERNKTTSDEDSYEISLMMTPNSVQRNGSKEFNVSSGNKNKLLENSDLKNTSKSISRKTEITKSPEENISSNHKSTKEKTLKHTRANTISPVKTSYKIVTQEAVSDDIDIEQDLSTSKSSFDEEIHLHANREYDSNMLKRLSKSSAGKETRWSNSMRNRSEIPKLANEIREDSHNNTNTEHDSSMLKQSKSSPNKQAHLMRNSLRDRSETPKLANVEVHEDINNSRNDASREHDSSMHKQFSKSSSTKEIRLTRNSLRNRSETPENTDVDEAIDNLNTDANKEYDSNMLKRLSKSSPNKEARLTRTSLKNQSKIPKLMKNVQVPKQSLNSIDIEKDNDVNIDSEKNTDGTSQISSTRKFLSKFNANLGTPTILSTEMERIDDEDADSARQISQRNSFSTVAEISSKAINRQNMQNSDKISIKDNRESASRQKSLNKSQNYRKLTKSSNKDSFNEQNSSKTLRKLDDFFKIKQTSTKQSSERTQKSQVFDSEQMKKIKMELEKIKNREMAAMKINPTDEKESVLKMKNMKSIMSKQTTKKKPLTNSTKVVDKAYLVNGKIYKAPKLPRPKYWVTNRLYQFLWKRMEPRYKLATRLKSEKFVQELAKIIAVIERRKNYENYKTELEALMKEMARLKIINTRVDFYHFCQDFLPYEFRIKVVPMLLPGNKSNIPYSPEKLHVPLISN